MQARLQRTFGDRVSTSTVLPLKDLDHLLLRFNTFKSTQIEDYKNMKSSEARKELWHFLSLSNLLTLAIFDLRYFGNLIIDISGNTF